MQTKINWFEIPSIDFQRAARFYESIFDTTLRVEDFGNMPMAIFTAADGNSVGCVIHSEQVMPSDKGPVMYLDATSSFDAVLARIEPAGGRILMEKMELPRELGFIAHFLDSEGNRVALHAAH